MKKIVLGTIIAAASVFAAANTAACAGCHGADFGKSALGKSQIVKGWPAEKVEAALHGYKDGSYGGAMKGVMKGQVARLSDADIKEIAEKISKL